jgi:hypothetical protein
MTMIEATATPWSAWESFYVIVGSSAAALTGLQFVVMALISDSSARRGHHEIATFGTPTIVHFCAVLLLSGILSAPWPSLAYVDIAIGISGFVGVLYSVLVLWRARRTKLYQPVAEDWLFHVILPFVAYGTLVVAAILLGPYVTMSLFLIAGSALLLLFVGIHNAWDTATWVALNMSSAAAPSESTNPPAPPKQPADTAPEPPIEQFLP